MIHNVITAVSHRLNIYIKNRLMINDDPVVVKNLVDLKEMLTMEYKIK